MTSLIRDIDRWFAEQVYVHHQQHRRVALRLTGNHEDAEEIVQDAYARLFAYEQWQRLGNPNGFTLRIIRNLAIDRFRQADVVRIDRNPAVPLAELADDAPLPDAAAAHHARDHGCAMTIVRRWKPPFANGAACRFPTAAPLH